MEHHKVLYKDNSTLLSPRQLSRRNREINNAKRAKQREDNFLSTRNITMSPSPFKALPLPASTPAKNEDKENCSNANDGQKNEMCSSRIAKVACNPTPLKLSRKEAFLQRFIDWKQKKKQEKELKKQEQQNQRRPFVSAGSVNSTSRRNFAANACTTSSFAPKYHQFKAPTGLKNPAESETPNSTQATTSNVKKRQSIYTLVPTPPKKKTDLLQIKKGPITAKKTLPPPPNPVRANFKWTSSKTVATAPTSIKKINNLKCAFTPTVAIAGTSHKKMPISTGVVPKTVVKSRQLLAPPAATRRPTVPRTAPRIVKAIQDGGVKDVGGSLHTKATVYGAASKASSFKLSASLKAKKPDASTTAAARKLLNAKKETKMFLALAELAFEATAETPNYLTNTNPFEAFVTSTRQKSHSSSNGADEFSIDCDGISPIDLMQQNESQSLRRNSSNSSAKRVLQLQTVGLNGKPKDNLKLTNKFNFIEMDDGSVKESTCVESHLVNGMNQLVEGVPWGGDSVPDENLKNKPKHKFNFLRYSVVDTDLDITATEKDVVKITEESQPRQVGDCEDAMKLVNATETDGDKTFVQHERTVQEISHFKTPPKEETAERPANYMSPFVSVSRGKVNARKEKEKRNSIYLQAATNELLQHDKPHTPDMSVEVRRTIETVRYFRIQLRDEITRLHALCDQWEAYKDQNLTRLQETGGEDMINVTIGQTKLLTSKKFMQFNGLIDRCEAGATGIGATVCDGSEKTKPITAVDLEGFWVMVGLQVDNVEKRFENLQRWKSNDWVDPDEVVVIAKKSNVKMAKKPKTTAAKAKPSSALQQMLRKIHLNMRQKNAAEAAFAKVEEVTDVTLTPLRKPRRSQSSTPSSTPRNISVIVRDRKSRSAAATVVSIPTSNHRRNSVMATASPHKHSPRINASPKLLSPLRQFRRSLNNMQKGSDRKELLKSALMGDATAGQLRHMSLVPLTPQRLNSPAPTPNGRKSILKTPGTAKGKPKSVIFNEQLRIKKFKFTIEDEQSDEDDEDELRSIEGYKLESSKRQEEQKQQQEKERDVANIDQGTYGLRTRKVILRPSCEIKIPFKPT